MTEEATGAVTTVFSNIKNNVVSQLAAPATNTDVAVSLMTGTGASFPTAPFYCSVEYEVMWCTNKVGDSLQVQRGVDGTQASAHPINAVIQIRNNAGLFLDAYDAIREIDAGVTSGAALPSDVVYLDKTQELTHKTIDLTSGSKANVIIGNVSADPATLNYQNILMNGGFEDWTLAQSTTIPAGAPTSGFKAYYFSLPWTVEATNDSSITVARDTTHTDPSFPSGVNCLINLSTIQGSDTVGIAQEFNRDRILGSVEQYDLDKLAGNPVSISARVRLVSGNVQMRFGLWNSYSGVWTVLYSPFTQVTSVYSTYKFENQPWFPNVNAENGIVKINFQGTGQVAIDNVMLIVGPVATVFRPSFPSIGNARLAPSVQRHNLLTNGGFDIWQRGPGPYTIGVGSWTADKWQVAGAGGDTISISKDTTNVDYYTGACAACTFTKGTGTTGLMQIITGADFPQTMGKYFSFSIRVKTSTPNAIRPGIFNGSAWAYGKYHPGDGTYQTLSVMSATSGAFTQIGVWFDATCTAYIDNAMLVPGMVPADYVTMHPADELARCLRYYEIIGESGNSLNITAYQAAGTGYWVPYPYKARKAVNPTVTKNGTWVTLNTAQPGIWGGGVDAFSWGAQAVAQGVVSIVNGNAGNTITAEANP